MSTTNATHLYFLITVDGDLRLGSLEQQAAALRVMRAAHADLGLTGRTTWFINEYDFHWTEGHPTALIDLTDTGEALGVHDHLDTHYAGTYAEALALMQTALQRLRDFFEQAGRTVELVHHRNGCGHQSEAAYRALLALGYETVSDVRPALAWHSRMLPDQTGASRWRCLGPHDTGAIFTDNRGVPLSATPWHHAAHNWLDYTSTSGPLLQVPITCAPWIEHDRIEAAFQAAQNDLVLVLDTHPYDLQDPASGEMCPQRVTKYVQSIEWVRDTYHPTFVRIDQVPICLAQKQPAVSAKEAF